MQADDVHQDGFALVLTSQDVWEIQGVITACLEKHDIYTEKHSLLDCLKNYSVNILYIWQFWMQALQFYM